MDAKEEKRLSKFMSKVLRHDPAFIDLTLDEAGWASVNDLIEKMNVKGAGINQEKLEQVVANNDKQRFAFSKDGLRIRANQGHSIKVEHGFTAIEPPETLFHGTATRNLDSILANGLLKGKRHHVHLSPDKETAIKVGQRHGKPIVLVVQAKQMHEQGHEFFCSENGVWLVDRVPTEYLSQL